MDEHSIYEWNKRIHERLIVKLGTSVKVVILELLYTFEFFHWRFAYFLLVVICHWKKTFVLYSDLYFKNLSLTLVSLWSIIQPFCTINVKFYICINKSFTSEKIMRPRSVRKQFDLWSGSIVKLFLWFVGVCYEFTEKVDIYYFLVYTLITGDYQTNNI